MIIKFYYILYKIKARLFSSPTWLFTDDRNDLEFRINGSEIRLGLWDAHWDHITLTENSIDSIIKAMTSVTGLGNFNSDQLDVLSSVNDTFNISFQFKNNHWVDFRFPKSVRVKFMALLKVLKNEFYVSN